MLLGERKNKRTNPIHYDYGTKLLNYTKNLVVKNNVYDSYTHEYLGDYLRFQRDYNNLDLMPLYNCFSNRACENLIIKGEISTVIDRKVKVNATTAHTTTYNTTFEFNTKDPNYKIYMMPIKMFKTYTIAIDSDQPVEFCCGIYGNYQDTRSKFNALPMLTYQRVNQSQFTKPFLYTKLSLNAIES
jgi:hypothetical protein